MQLRDVPLKRGEPKDTLPKDTFIVGRKYEMYIPIAHVIEEEMNVTFKDSTTYQFTCHGYSKGHFWTKDISYGYVEGHGNPPPPSPTMGSPFIQSANAAIRLATDE